ncbi:MAG: hypothetical protein AABW45_00945 [Nanoarchaeota archaeon]
MFDKSLSEAKLEGIGATKILEEAINQIKSLFLSDALTDLKSDYIKERISKIRTLLNLADARLKSAKSKIPKN